MTVNSSTGRVETTNSSTRRVDTRRGPTGGDLKDCLTSTEINDVVGTRLMVPAEAFYEARQTQDGHQQLAERLRGRDGLVIIHVRHHWLAAHIAKNRFTVYDSALSAPVQRDMRALAMKMGWNPPTFASCPQQHYGTNECGVFAILNILMLAEHIPIPPSTAKVRLAELRDILIHGPDTVELLRVGKNAYGITKIRQNDPYGLASGGARQKHSARCPSCNDWVKYGEQCHSCNKQLCHCGRWKEGTCCNHCEPSPAPLPSLLANEREEPHVHGTAPCAGPPSVGTLKREEEDDDQSSQDFFEDVVSEQVCDSLVTKQETRKHADQPLNDIFTRSLQHAAPSSDPNVGSRTDQHHNDDTNCQATRVGSGRSCQIDARHSPSLAAMALRNAKTVPGIAGSNSSVRVHEGSEGRARMDMGHHTQEHGKCSGRSGVAANVPSGGARGATQARRYMGGEHARCDTLRTRGRASHTQGDDDGDLHGYNGDGTRSPASSRAGAHVVHGTTRRMRAPAIKGQHALESKRHPVCHAQTREECQTARSLHGAHNVVENAEADVDAVLQRCETRGATVHTHASGYAEHLPSSRCNDGGAFYSARDVAGNGTSWCTERHTERVQWTHQRQNPATVSQLGESGWQCTYAHGNSRKSPLGINIEGHVPSWAALGVKPQRKQGEQPPLHAKDVVNKVDYESLLRLPQSAQLRQELERALRWVRTGEIYEILERATEQTDMRRTHSGLRAEHVEKLVEIGKFEKLQGTPMAYCNAMLRTEEKEEGTRLRALLEPVVNDLIRQLAKTDERFDVSTRYATKDEIRHHVYLSECAAQFDFAAWFDQLMMHPDNRKFFTIDTAYGLYVLVCLAMGFMPSCQVAQACTNTIRAVEENVYCDSCVDNVAFMGSPASVTKASEQFIKRCDLVGAVLKDRTIKLITDHDFLGEHYNHITKTRALTRKTADKAAYVHQLLQHEVRFSTKKLRAMYGLLIYAAGTLNMTMATYHWALRFLSHVASTDETTVHSVPVAVVIELLAWSQRAAENQPVQVWTPALEPEYVLYTDASAYGYGAISLSKGGNMLQLSQQWSEADRATWNVNSSVTAEPLAIQRAIAALIPNSAKKVVIYTDHLPFVYAHSRSVGKAFMYSRTIQFMSAYQTQFEVRFIEGTENPADVLSRARPMATITTPPRLLNVSSVGKDMFQEGERRGSMG